MLIFNVQLLIINALYHRQQVLPFQTLIGHLVHDVLHNKDAHAAKIPLRRIGVHVRAFFHCRIKLPSLITEHKGQFLVVRLGQPFNSEPSG